MNKKRTNGSSNRKVRGNRKFRKDMDKDPKLERDQSKLSEENYGSNDPLWYAFASPQLLQDVAQNDFVNATGIPIDLQNPYPNGFATGSPAGIMTIDWYPSVSPSTDNTSAINMATRSMFTYIRSRISGARTYEAPDIMMYYIAMDSVYTLLNEAIRVYGLMQTYKLMNAYYPKQIVEALGWDWDNLRDNMADFRAVINFTIKELQTYPVANAFYYAKRHRLLSSQLYVDATTSKAQNFAFVAKGFYKYNEYDGATKLDMIDRPANKFTLESFSSFISDLVNPLLVSQDMRQMAADMLSVFGRENFYTIPTISEDFRTVEVYEPEILQQINNMTIITGLTKDKMVITQETDIGENSGAILFKPIIPETTDGEFDNTYLEGNALLNFDLESPTSADVMNATRLVCSAEKQTDGTLLITSSGSELVVGVNVWIQYIYSKTGELTFNEVPVKSNTYRIPKKTVAGDVYNGLLGLINLLGPWSNFDWAPPIYVGSTSPTDQVRTAVLIYDMNNYTLLPQYKLKNLNRLAMLSLLGTPTLLR